MCYFQDFKCHFQKYYYLLPHELREPFKEIFITKLPHPLGQTIKEKFNQRKQAQTIPDTLGGIIKIIEDYQIELCTQKSSEKLVRQTTKCCDQFIDVPQAFGCRKYPSRRGNTKRRQTTFITKRKPYYNSQKYSFRKRRFNPKNRERYFKKQGVNEKKKYCPEKKSTCKCWLCHAEGHYANDCPKRNQRTEKVKFLEQINNIGLEPVESDDSDHENRYYYMQYSSNNSEEEFEIEETDYESEK